MSEVTLREGETQESLLKRFFVSKGEAARDKQRRAASRRRAARS